MEMRVRSICQTYFIYMYLVKSDVPLICIEKRPHALNKHIDSRTLFRRIIKTTQDTHLRWFSVQIDLQNFAVRAVFISYENCQFSNMYILWSWRRNLEHMFWDCIKTQVFWRDWIYWLVTHFPHCSHLRLSKEFVIFGCESNLYTDIIIDLLIPLAKYHIFQAKTNNSTPLIQVFFRTVKQRFVVEKYNAVVNINTFNFRREWTL